MRCRLNHGEAATAWTDLLATSSPLAANGRQVEAPVMSMPGVADGVVSLTLGLRPQQGRGDRKPASAPMPIAIRTSRAALGDSEVRRSQRPAGATRS